MSNETQIAEQPAQNTQVAKPSAKRTFQQLVDSDQFKAQITAALPKHITAERFIRVLMTATIKNPQLLECTQESMFKGIFDCAAIGLELDGRRAHLVPLRNRKKPGQPLEANLWLDYKGISELVMRSGLVSNIHADIVCENDEFEYDRGQLTKHKIDFRKDRGSPYAAYCIIRMKDGGEKVEVMSYPEIERVRNASPGANAQPWTDHWPEMAKKCVFKRASKWVPLSSEMKNALEAEHDDEPINVTPKQTIGALIGAPAAESAPAAIEQAPEVAEAKAEDPVPEKKAKAKPEPKNVTQESADDRNRILAELESAILAPDATITEAKLLAYARAEKLVPEGVTSLWKLPTEALGKVAAAIPGMGAAK